MTEDPQKVPNQDEIDDKTSPGKGVVQLVQSLDNDDDTADQLDQNERLDKAVDASAAEEEKMQSSVDAYFEETDGSEDDESDTSENAPAPSHDRAGPSADMTPQRVFPASDALRDTSVAIPLRYDGPQLVGVTVSTAGTDAAEGVGLADLTVILKRNLRMIFMIVLCVTAFSALALSQVTPRYSSAAKILLGAPVSANRGTEFLLSGLLDDEASLQSQVAVLTSTDLALRVIDTLNLAKHPEFAPDPDTSDQPVAGGLSPAKMQTVNRYHDRLRVEHLPKTRVVTVGFSATDPTVASGTANTIAELYIQDQRESKFGALNESAEWLSAQVSDVRLRVAEAELAIENFKLESGLIEGSGITLSDQELSSLNAQLIESRARTTEANARLAQIRNLLTTPDGVDSAAEVLDSSLIQRLRERESTLLADIAELGADLGEKHPRMMQMQAEAYQVSQEIDQEMNKIVKALEYQYNIQQSREQSIESSLSTATGQLEVSADAMVRLNTMEREAAADRLLLETMLGQLKQLNSQVDMSTQEPDARIISRALSPIEPSFPMTRALLALSVIGSALLAIMFVLVREFTDRTIRSSRQMIDELHLTPFGVFPRVTRRQRKGGTLFQYAVRNPRSRYAEAARAIAQKIVSVGLSGGGSTIMTAAAQHGEGKSDTALMLANALTALGRTVILIDADHYRPQLHDQVDVPAAPGLVETINRRSSIKDAVYTAMGVGTFAFMPSGNRSSRIDGGPDYADLGSTLAIFKQHFDYIIINAPPVLMSNDSILLGRMCDASIVSMRWGKTHRRTANICVEKLVQAGCQNVGGVLIDVNLGKYELYEYGQSGAYTSASDDCYAN